MMKSFTVLFLFMIGPVASATPLAADLVTLHGRVLDQKTQHPVNAGVDIFLNSDFIVDFSAKTNNGAFTATLQNFGWYIISISAPGYLEHTDTLWVRSEKTRTVNKDFYMTSIEIGLTVALNNVYFNSNAASLSEQSFTELDKVVSFFNANPDVTFEIAGHTDSYGEEDYNLQLSQGRAQAVVDFLVDRGVNSSRLIARGYGETKPIDAGANRAASAKNRRVELKVLATGSEENKEN